MKGVYGRFFWMIGVTVVILFAVALMGGGINEIIEIVKNKLFDLGDVTANKSSYQIALTNCNSDCMNCCLAAKGNSEEKTRECERLMLNEKYVVDGKEITCKELLGVCEC